MSDTLHDSGYERSGQQRQEEPETDINPIEVARDTSVGLVNTAAVDQVLDAFDADDADQFAELYRFYKPSLTRYARSARAIDPDGVANLALFDGYRALDNMRRRDYQAFTGYLYQAVRSHVAREYRRTINATPAVIDDQVLKPTASFESELVDSLMVRELIEQLPTEQRAVVNHRFIDGLTAQETGRLLDKEPNAVYQLQHRATRRLQRMILGALIVALMAAAAVIIIRQADTQVVDSSPAEPDQQEVDPAPVPDPTAERERPPESPPTTEPTDAEAVQTENADVVPAPIQAAEQDVTETEESVQQGVPATTVPGAAETPAEPTELTPDLVQQTETTLPAEPIVLGPPVAARNDIVNATVGEAIDVNVMANDESSTLDTDAVVLFSGGVDGLTLSDDGQLTGTPTKPGTSIIVYRLLGTNGDSDLGQIQVTVQ